MVSQPRGSDLINMSTINICGCGCSKYQHDILKYETEGWRITFGKCRKCNACEKYDGGEMGHGTTDTSMETAPASGGAEDGTDIGVLR